MIEAMARGLPALGTSVGGIPELLPADRLVPPDDPGALARALGRLCGAGTDRVALGLRDLAVARRYRRAALRPRRLEFYRRLRAGAVEALDVRPAAEGAA